MTDRSPRSEVGILPYKVVLTTDDRKRATDFISGAWKHGHYTGTRWVNTAALALVEVNAEAYQGRVIRTASRYAVVEEGA